jgi:hypothetical protein
LTDGTGAALDNIQRVLYRLDFDNDLALRQLPGDTISGFFFRYKMKTRHMLSRDYRNGIAYLYDLVIGQRLEWHNIPKINDIHSDESKGYVITEITNLNATREEDLSGGGLLLTPEGERYELPKFLYTSLYTCGDSTVITGIRPGPDPPHSWMGVLRGDSLSFRPSELTNSFHDPEHLFRLYMSPDSVYTLDVMPRSECT